MELGDRGRRGPDFAEDGMANAVLDLDEKACGPVVDQIQAAGGALWQ